LMGAYNETPREVTLRDLMGACHLTWCVRKMIRRVIWLARTLRRHVIWWVRTDVSAEDAAFTFSEQDLLFRREIGQQASPILWYISNKLYGVTSQKMLVLLIIFFSLQRWSVRTEWRKNKILRVCCMNL
jgi:hypothetical protein